MQPYRCGCASDGSARCKSHRHSRCHTRTLPSANAPSECPPCFRARMMSVDTSPASQLLSHARRPGIPPHVRQAAPDEFSPDLTMHSKVRQ